MSSWISIGQIRNTWDRGLSDRFRVTRLKIWCSDLLANIMQRPPASESLKSWVRSLETQPGFHRCKVAGFKEAVESLISLPLEETFLVELFKSISQVQGFHIVQLNEVISLIKQAHGIEALQSEVDKVLQMCQMSQRGQIAMDISLCLDIVLDILKSADQAENTAAFITGKVEALDSLYRELAETGAVDLREIKQQDNFEYKPDCFHSSKTFRECYKTLSSRSHFNSEHALIKATVSLVRVEKTRQTLSNPHNCDKGDILRAWIELLKTSYISTNLAILIAHMEEDRCNRTVEALAGRQPSKADGHSAEKPLPIVLPDFVAGARKLTSQSEDQSCGGEAIFHMMSAPEGFDTGPDCFEAATSQAQVEKRWRLLLDAVPTWKEYPLDIMKLFLDVSITNDDLERVLCVQSNGTVIVPCVTKFLDKIKESKGREEATATTADGAEELRGEKRGEEGNAQAGTRNVFTRIFFILLSLFRTLTDLINKASIELLECSEKVSAKEMETMLNLFRDITGRRDISPEKLWNVLVAISCNSRIRNKTEVWKKYHNIHSSLQWQQELFIFFAGALGLLSEKNALVLLDESPPAADLICVLCRKVIVFPERVNGDVNNHFSLIFSIVKRHAVKKEVIGPLLEFHTDLSNHPRPCLISQSVYETLLAAIAGAVEVGTYHPSVDNLVINCVTGALPSLSEPIEVISLFMDLKGLFSRARKYCSASYGQRLVTMILSNGAPVQVPLLEGWMQTFVNGTHRFLQCSDDTITGKMSLLKSFYDAVVRDGLDEPGELRNAFECLNNLSTELATHLKPHYCGFRFAEELLKIPNILRILGREVNQRGPPFLVSLGFSFTPSFVKRFAVDEEMKDALEIYRLLATLATDAKQTDLLLWICQSALENPDVGIKHFSQLFHSMVTSLRKASPNLLPFMADFWVAVFRCGLTNSERKQAFREVKNILDPSAYIRTPLNECELFVKGWQRSTNNVQLLRDRLFIVGAHMKDNTLPVNQCVRYSDLYRNEVHWLVSETSLSPVDIALCIRLCAPAFDEKSDLLQGAELSSPTKDSTRENDKACSSPFRVVVKFLFALRRQFEDIVQEETLIEGMLRIVFNKNYCWTIGTSADGKLSQKLRSAKEGVDDLLALISSCTCVDQLLIWLESPHLLTNHSTMAVVLAACQRKKDETDMDIKLRLDVNRKCKFLLEYVLTPTPWFGLQIVHPTLERLGDILKSDLSYELIAKLLDLFGRRSMVASVCGRAISQWQSSAEGMELLDTFLSRWPSKGSSTDDDSFEYMYLSRLPSYPESAEGFYRLWSRLHALRKLEEHVPLVMGLMWHEVVVSKSRMDATVASTWLRIFYAGGLKLQEVHAVAYLTSGEAGQLLLPGSTCIDDCLFTPATVNAILDNGKLDKNALQFYLIVARMLSEILGAVQRMEKEEWPQKTLVLEILRRAAKKICEDAQSVVARGGGDTPTRTDGVRKADRKQLYSRRQYLKGVFGEMSSSSGDGALRGDWSSGKSHMESILVLLRRWLAAHPKMPAMGSHVSHIFGLVAHGIKLPQATEVSSQTSSHELRGRRSSPTHCDPGEREGRQVSESAQRVQEYVLNLKENQACIARLQNAGYNRGAADLWHGDSQKLTAQIRRQDVSHTVERNRILKHICQPYLTLLIELKVGVVEVGGEAKRVSELFASDLTLEELNREVSAVRRSLAEMEDESLQGKIRPVLTLEEERQEYIRTLRDYDAQVDHVMKACSRSPTRTEH